MRCIFYELTASSVPQSVQFLLPFLAVHPTNSTHCPPRFVALRAVSLQLLAICLNRSPVVALSLSVWLHPTKQ